MNRSLVLIHGFGGGPADWEEFLSYLKWPGSVHALTLPGHGAHREPREAWLDRVAREIPGRAALLGYSMGGRMAALLAAKRALHGRPLEALVLVSAGLGFVSAKERLRRAEEDRTWANLLRGAPEDFWRAWYEQEIFESFRRGIFPGKSRWLARREGLQPEELSCALEEFGSASHEALEPVLAQQIRCPLLYIAGEKDKKYAAAAGRVDKSVPGARARIVKGAGHVLPVEAPGALAEMVAEFLRS